MAHEYSDAGAEYPLNSPSFEPSRYNAEEIRRQLSAPPTECFATAENEAGISLRIIDLSESSNENENIYAEKTCRTVKQAEEALIPPSKEWPEAARRPRVRIISIHSATTIEPLQITSSLMRRLLWAYDVTPEFVPIIFAFGDNETIAESGNSNMYVQSRAGESKKLSYEIRYVENNGRKLRPWSERHTGVYHHHERDFDVFILLQSLKNNTAERRIRNMAGTEAGIRELQEICKNPFRLHVLIASSYFLDWRWYLRDLARDFNEINDLAMILSPDGPGPESLTYEQVRSLRNIQDKVISAKANCKGDLEVMEGLAALKGSDIEELYGLPFQIKQLEGFLDSAEVLRCRIRNTIELVDYSLNRHVQVETMRVYGEMSTHTKQVHRLTKDNNKNNTTVTIVTLVSAFYLPGSFVASLYGMNFFLFDPTYNSIVIAHDFWIFIITWLPLMALTYGLYYVVRRNEERPIKWPWKNAVPTPKRELWENSYMWRLKGRY